MEGVTPKDLKNLIDQEDEVVRTLECWPKFKQFIAYEWLYAKGARIQNIRADILKAFHEEEEQQKVRVGRL